MSRPLGFIGGLYGILPALGNMLEPVAALCLRLAMAYVFLPAGLKKAKDLDGAATLFQYEFFEGISSGLAKTLATVTMVAEIALPALLIIGLFTRFAALGLLIMSGVIFVLVFPEAFKIEYWWTAILFAIFARGPGGLSLDYLIGLDRGHR